jgi:hypothetical protein
MVGPLDYLLLCFWESHSQLRTLSIMGSHSCGSCPGPSRRRRGWLERVLRRLGGVSMSLGGGDDGGWLERVLGRLKVGVSTSLGGGDDGLKGHDDVSEELVNGLKRVVLR